MTNDNNKKNRPNITESGVIAAIAAEILSLTSFQQNQTKQDHNKNGSNENSKHIKKITNLLNNITYINDIENKIYSYFNYKPKNVENKNINTIIKKISKVIEEKKTNLTIPLKTSAISPVRANTDTIEQDTVIEKKYIETLYNNIYSKTDKEIVANRVQSYLLLRRYCQNLAVKDSFTLSVTKLAYFRNTIASEDIAKIKNLYKLIDKTPLHQDPQLEAEIVKINSLIKYIYNNNNNTMADIRQALKTAEKSDDTVVLEKILEDILPSKNDTNTITDTDTGVATDIVNTTETTDTDTESTTETTDPGTIDATDTVVPDTESATEIEGNTETTDTDTEYTDAEGNTEITDTPSDIEGTGARPFNAVSPLSIPNRLYNFHKQAKKIDQNTFNKLSLAWQSPRNSQLMITDGTVKDKANKEDNQPTLHLNNGGVTQETNNNVSEKTQQDSKIDNTATK